jgi:uncharacterized membrane protein
LDRDRRRDARLRAAALLLAGAGVVMAAYLTWVHYAHATPACLGGGGCQRVQGSDYSELTGIPVAAIGLAGYLAILVSQSGRLRTALWAGAFLSLVGFGFSQYLTYLELFVIDAVCQWCVASDAVMTALAVTTVWRAVE